MVWRPALGHVQGRRGLSRGHSVSIDKALSGGEERAAHAGSTWCRHTTDRPRDEGRGYCGRMGQQLPPRAQKWAVCPALGRDTRAGCRCWRAPSSAAGLALLQGARPRSGRRRTPSLYAHRGSYRPPAALMAIAASRDGQRTAHASSTQVLTTAHASSTYMGTRTGMPTPRIVCEAM